MVRGHRQTALNLMGLHDQMCECFLSRSYVLPAIPLDKRLNPVPNNLPMRNNLDTASPDLLTSTMNTNLHYSHLSFSLAAFIVCCRIIFVGSAF